MFAAGDVDADGYGDLLGVPRGRGELWLYRGSATGPESTAVVLRDERFEGGEAASAPGDLNGDGFDDVALGVPTRDRVIVLYGAARPFERVDEINGRAGTEFGRALP